MTYYSIAYQDSATPPISCVIRLLAVAWGLAFGFVLLASSGSWADDTEILDLDKAIDTAIENVRKTGGKEITLKAVGETVDKAGHSIVGSGSHIGGGYTAGKSDHDFTYRLTHELDVEEAVDAWQDARKKFAKEIRDETKRQFEKELRNELRKAGITDPQQIDSFVKQATAEKRVAERVVGAKGVANEILERTNLYPPDEVMGKVANSQEAMKKFKEMKTVPRLSEQAGKELSDDVLKKATEGVYGPGGKAYRQSYERSLESKAGAIWQTDPKTKKARRYGIDLTHLEEMDKNKYELFTVQGTANVGKQRADKVLDALKEGDIRTAFKNLDRLHKDMKKARDLASLSSPGSTGVENYATQYEKIKKEAEAAAWQKGLRGEEAKGYVTQRVNKEIEKLFADNPGLKQEIQSAVEAASKEADLLQTFAGEFSANRKMFIRKLLGGSSEAGAQLKSALGELYEKYGHHISLINAISAIFITLDTAETASRAGQEDWEGALRKGIETALGIPPTLLPAGLMAVMTNLVIDTAKEAGYTLAVAGQDCEDLLAGIIAVKGWEDVKSFGDKTETSVDALARRLPLETQVRNVVAALARNAATGQEGTATINTGKEEALVTKCSDQIVAKWRQRRLELLSNYLDVQTTLNEAFENLKVELVANPNPAQIKTSKRAASRSTTPSSVAVVIQARTKGPVDQINKLLDEMRERIMLLGGQQKLVILTLTKRTEWFKGDDTKPFAGHTQPGEQLKEVLDETSLVFHQPESIKVSCRITWVLKVISAITDPTDYTTTSVEIVGPLMKGELPGFRTRVIPGDVVGTHKDRLGRIYTKQSDVLISVVGTDEPDKEIPVKADTAPTPPSVPPSQAAGKPVDPSEGAPKGQPTIPPGTTGRPEPSDTRAGGAGADAGAGVQTGAGGQTGLTGRPDAAMPPGTGVAGDAGTAGPPEAGRTEQPESGATKQPESKGKGAIGVSGGQDGQSDTVGKPQPTQEEMRLAFLNCLCRSCGSIGGYYNTGDSCGGARPCACWGPLSCWSSPIPTGAELIKSCYASAYGIKDPTDFDLQNALQILQAENKKHAPPLKAKLSPAECPKRAQLGDVVNFSVAVEGGTGPYTVAWSGEGEAKDRSFIFAKTRKPGSYPISATISDSDGNTATVSCTVIVDALTVEIVKTSPADNTLPIGSRASFKAIVKSGSSQLSGPFTFRWQPHPEVQFGDAKKPQFETNDPTATATYTKMGTFPMWVQVLKKVGGTYQTVGESNQLPMTIVKPKLKLTVDNKAPKVGSKVTLTVHEEPKMNDDAINFWWEYSGNADNPGPAPGVPNSRAYSLKPKDTKPITVTVHGKTKDGKDDLGEDKATITAQGYTITVTGPKAAGPKPKIWKCDTQLGGACPGLVEVDKEIAVHQRVEFSAGVSPKPESELRYNWTVSGSSCTLSNPITKDVGVTCSETGSYQMTVAARDKNNIELGQGTGMLAVTISQEGLNTAAAKAKPKVTVTADTNVLTAGESVGARATVDGGKTPYSYKWTGDYEGQGQSVRFSPKRPGDHTLSVEATDAAGNKAAANVTFKVEALKLTIEGLRDEVVYGTTLSLSVKPDNQRIIWKSEPAITFTPQQSVGGQTRASFARIGSVRIWATAQGKTGATLGESDKKEVRVTVPTFEMTFDPPKGKVGEEVKATIKTTPAIDPSLVKFVWVAPMPSDIKTYRANVIGATPKRIGAMEFVALAKDPAKHQTLAEIKGTYTAEAVKLDVALRPDKTRLVVGETTAIRADVKGGKTPYTFIWTGEHAGAGPSVRVAAHKAGQQRLAVEVTDLFGNKGAAETNIIIEQPAVKGVEQAAAKRPVETHPAATVDPSAPFATTTTRGPSPEEYDPTKDPNFIEPGTPSKEPIDMAAVKALGKEFQQRQFGGTTTTTGQPPQPVIPQPESYRTDPGQKKSEGSVETQQPPYPPYPPPAGYPPAGYPPGYLPGVGQPSVRVPWRGLAQPSTRHSGRSRESAGSPQGPSGPSGYGGTSQGSTGPSLGYGVTSQGGTSASGAPGPSSGPRQSVGYVTAQITNRSREAAHIFTDGETFGPGNRFGSGQTKQVNVRVSSNNRITFFAGRNGQVIASKVWYYDPGHPDSIPVVVFDDSNPYDKLSIMKGLR